MWLTAHGKDLTETEVFILFAINTESARNRISKTELHQFNYSEALVTDCSCGGHTKTNPRTHRAQFQFVSSNDPAKATAEEEGEEEEEGDGKTQ